MLGDIVKGDESARAHQRRVHFEVALHAFVAVVPVNKQEVQALSGQQVSGCALSGFGQVRVASN